MAKIDYPSQLSQAVRDHKYPLLFATISGAHLYGFPSPDSDYDLRGVHVLPLQEIVGMTERDNTVTTTKLEDGLELDLVTHDIKKFFKLMLRKNGYVLEQLYSPLVVHKTSNLQELKTIGKSCITRHHYHHYAGFSANQWRLLEKEEPPRVKPLLYVYRVLLTGIYLMQNARIEANLVTLNKEFQLPYIDELVEAKVSTNEKHKLTKLDLDFHRKEFKRLRGALETAFLKSDLPETPTAAAALDDLLRRVRLGSV
ncbi:MAG TPA: nucleotidyltransferase domain-containing protein [Oculatellaceae cyanobacterium]